MKTEILHADTAGSGRPVLLIHGLAGSGRYWADIWRRLGSGYRAVAVDLLGFGRSPRPRTSRYTSGEQVGAIQAALVRLGVKGKMVVVGHSMGALIGLEFARRNPDQVAQLILINPPVYLSFPEAKRMITGGKWRLRLTYYGLTSWLICQLTCQNPLVGQWLWRRVFAKLPIEVVADIRRHSWRAYRRSRINVLEQQKFFEQLQGLKVPVMLLVGSDDPAWLAHRAEWRQLQQPVEVRVVEGAGHHLPLTHPEAVLATVREAA